MHMALVYCECDARILVFGNSKEAMANVRTGHMSNSFRPSLHFSSKAKSCTCALSNFEVHINMNTTPPSPTHTL